MSLQSEQYIPHRGKMSLIDNVLEVNDDYALCEVIITDQSTFYEAEISGIYNWVGVEYMAQCVASYAGFHSQSINIGLLLSVRRFKSTLAFFSEGSVLKIKANKVFLEESLGVFDCEIKLGGELIASAKLNTFQPPADKIDEILKGKVKT